MAEPSAATAPEESDQTSATRLTDVAQRLDELVMQGAEGFDRPAVDFVRALLERARGLGGLAGDRLGARAGQHLEVLVFRFEAARREALAHVEQLDAEGPRAAASARARLEAGQFEALGRRAHQVAQPGDGARAPRVGKQAYRDALAELCVARSAAMSGAGESEEDAGLLNGRVLAARILRHAGALAPSYRRALVAELFDLSALLHLPELKAPRKRG